MNAPAGLRAVADATPLIGLAKIGELGLLRTVFEQIIVPQVVFDEVVGAGVRRPGTEELLQAAWVQVRHVKDRSSVGLLLAELNAGEAEAIVLARETAADRLLIDERKGRIVARRLGLQIIGTAGLLVLAKKQGVLAEVRPVLTRLIEADFRLSDRVVRSVLTAAGEAH